MFLMDVGPRKDAEAIPKKNKKKSDTCYLEDQSPDQENQVKSILQFY